jgi:LPXTG-motif cell wall-anchored protein
MQRATQILVTSLTVPGMIFGLSGVANAAHHHTIDQLPADVQAHAAKYHLQSHLELGLPIHTGNLAEAKGHVGFTQRTIKHFSGPLQTTDEATAAKLAVDHKYKKLQSAPQVTTDLNEAKRHSEIVDVQTKQLAPVTTTDFAKAAQYQYDTQIVTGKPVQTLNAQEAAKHGGVVIATHSSTNRDVAQRESQGQYLTQPTESNTTVDYGTTTNPADLLQHDNYLGLYEYVEYDDAPTVTPYEKEADANDGHFLRTAWSDDQGLAERESRGTYETNVVTDTNVIAASGTTTDLAEAQKHDHFWVSQPVQATQNAKPAADAKATVATKEEADGAEGETVYNWLDYGTKEEYTWNLYEYHLKHAQTYYFYSDDTTETTYHWNTYAYQPKTEVYTYHPTQTAYKYVDDAYEYQTEHDTKDYTYQLPKTAYDWDDVKLDKVTDDPKKQADLAHLPETGYQNNSWLLVSGLSLLALLGTGKFVFKRLKK